MNPHPHPTLGADPASVRRWNERVVLRALTGRGARRVADLAEATGLTPASVRDVLRTLVEKGWVDQTPPASSGVGRPARSYLLHEPPGRVLGLDVGGHTVRSVLLHPGGTLEPVTTVALAAPSIDATAAALRAATADVDLGTVWMTGLAVSGVVDASGLLTRSVALPFLAGTRPAEALAAALPSRVLVTHDTHAGLWAEHVIGTARDARDVMFVHLGRRPGVALLLDGQPYRGAHGTAGDLAFTDILPPTELAAGTDDYVRSVTGLLAFATALVDPAQVVLGGGRETVSPGAVAAFADALAERLPNPPRVTASSLDAYAVAAGAAHLARDAMVEALVNGDEAVAPLTDSSLTTGPWARADAPPRDTIDPFPTGRSHP